MWYKWWIPIMAKIYKAGNTCNINYDFENPLEKVYKINA